MKERKKERKKERQKERKKDRQTDRQKERQTERKKGTIGIISIYQIRSHSVMYLTSQGDSLVREITFFLCFQGSISRSRHLIEKENHERES